MVTKDEVISILEENLWHFAKTMPKIPHSYTRKREWDDPKAFIDAAAYISGNGVPEKFYRKTYNYLYSDTHKYWIMSDDPLASELINRAEI